MRPLITNKVKIIIYEWLSFLHEALFDQFGFNDLFLVDDELRYEVLVYSPDHFIISIEGMANVVLYKDEVKNEYDKKCRNSDSDHNHESFRYYIFRLLVPHFCNMILVYLEDDLKLVEFLDLLIGRKEGIHKEEAIFIKKIVVKTESPFGHLPALGILTYLQ